MGGVVRRACSTLALLAAVLAVGQPAAAERPGGVRAEPCADPCAYVSVVRVGSGRVTSDLADTDQIDCGTKCSAFVHARYTSVVLAADGAFLRWDNCPDPQGTRCSLDLGDAPRYCVTAVFEGTGTVGDCSEGSPAPPPPPPPAGGQPAPEPRQPAWNARCTIVGTAGRDVLRGTAGSDVLCGRGGHDVIDARGGFDLLRGGAGDDRLVGRAGRDRLDGGRGDDLLLGGAARDELRGGPGHDRARAERGERRWSIERVL